MTAQAWLAARAVDVPPALQARMDVAVAATAPRDTVARDLAAASLVCLREALVSCDDRASALPLLAADALVTYACEAATDDDAVFERLCAALDAPSLARAVGLSAP